MVLCKMVIVDPIRMLSNVCHPTILPDYVSSIVTMPILVTRTSPPVTKPLYEKPKIRIIQPKPKK